MFRKGFILGFLCLVTSSVCFAKDFGKRGHVFEIEEEDIAEIIKQNVRKIDMDKVNQEFQRRTKEYVERPTPVSGIKHTGEERTFYYDPTYTVKKDIRDHRGKVLYKKGYRLNPLDRKSLKENLIFIDGDDNEQVDFAIPFVKAKQAKVILTNGSPIKLQRKHKVWIYFDQKGFKTKKFGIKHVPAIVSQEGKRLKIREIKLTKR